MKRFLAIPAILILLGIGTSLPVEAEAPADLAAPKWVAALYVEARKAVGLRWSPVPGAGEYQVLRSETKGKDHKEIAKTAQPQHFDTKVEPGHTYYYILRVMDGKRLGPKSKEKEVAIPGKKEVKLQSPEITRILAQSSTEFGKTSYKASIFWDRVPGAIAYNLYRSGSGGEDYTMIASVAENQFFDTTVVPGETYDYYVTVLDSSFKESARLRQPGEPAEPGYASPEYQGAQQPPDLSAMVGRDVDEIIVIAKPPAGEMTAPAPRPQRSSPRMSSSVTIKKSTAKKRVKKIKLKVKGRSSDLMWFVQNGAGGGEFDYKEATDVAFSDDSNQVVAVGNSPKMLYVLDGTTGEFVRKFGGKGTDPGQFLDPVGLDLDADDNVVVVDRMRSILSIFTLGGNFVREIALPKAVPPGITVDPPLKKGLRFQEVAVDHDTGDFYVVEANNSRIWVLDEGGTVQRIWGDPGYGAGQLNGPLYIRFDPDGNLVTANLVSTRISTFSKEGEHLRSFGVKKAQVGGFVFMAGFDFDKEGNILVLDKASGTLQAFLPDGRYLYNLADESGESGASLYTPKSVAISRDNRVFVVEGLVDIVKGFRITGALPEPQEPPREVSYEPRKTPPARTVQAPPPRRRPTTPPPPPRPVAAREVPGSGEMRAVTADKKEIPLPLQHTEVEASIAGYIGTVSVTQEYRNPYDTKIEAVYVFPLPQNGAVTDFIMTIGERKIRGIIRERDEAERIYREAKRQGYTASLLTQERPNIFTQKVANIEPGKKIDIEIAYFHTLAYSEGEYTFTFPMVVGPRYNPPGSTDGVGAVGRRSRGASGQSTEVQYLRPDERSGHDVMITVDLDAGVEVEKIYSRSHAIDVERKGSTSAKVRLRRSDMIPNKDFVLRYRVGGKKIKSALMTGRDERGGYFTLMIQPPPELKDIPRAPQELVFVLDCSGSMNGWPMEKAKAAAKRAIEMLAPDDSFQIIRFSSSASALGPAPVRATPENIRRGIEYLEGLRGGGGTQMIEGIKAALDFPHDPRRFRVVSFMTDGFIGNEAQILAAIDERLGATRIFSFGVGSSVNRYLIERMAKVGQGAVAYIGPRDSDTEAVDRFYDMVRHAALTYIDVDWGNMEVSEIYPKSIPDLFAGRPVTVTGRFRGHGETTVKVRGWAGGEKTSLSIPVQLDDPGNNHRGISRVWARTKIADLMDRMSTGDNPSLAAEVLETALTYGLVSAYTAFVAVDSARRTAGDHGTTVDVPVNVPEGVRYETTVTEQGKK